MRDVTDEARTGARIDDLRRTIDEIDSEVMRLWQRRAEISQAVGRLRLSSGGPRIVLDRENRIIARYREKLGPIGVQLAMLVLRAGRGPLARRLTTEPLGEPPRQ
jgi:chorismate mutase